MISVVSTALTALLTALEMGGSLPDPSPKVRLHSPVTYCTIVSCPIASQKGPADEFATGAVAALVVSLSSQATVAPPSARTAAPHSSCRDLMSAGLACVGWSAAGHRGAGRCQ